MSISGILTTVRIVLVVMTGVLFFCCGENEVKEKDAASIIEGFSTKVLSGKSLRREKGEV